MKLRNRQSGEIKEFVLFDGKEMQSGLTLENLARDWKDYEPKEPLIKDEKVRKAVRAWAEANNIKAVYYYPEGDGFYVNNFDDEIVASIHFGDKPIEDGYGDQYTIDELCGEDEE